MSQTLLSLALVFAFASVVIIVQTSAGHLFARGDRAKRVNRRLAMFEAGLNREQVYARLTRAQITAQGAELAQNAEKMLRRLLQRAGVAAPLGRLALMLGGVIVGVWIASLLVWVRNAPGSGLVANALLSLAGSAVLSLLGAWIWLDHRRRARLKQIEVQLPIALDVMTRALRAGHPVVSSVQLAAEEMGDPLGSEFGLIIDETTYGAELPEALANFAERSGSADAYFMAVSVAVQAETGGNLSEILEGLAKVIRGRTSLVLKVKALSSEGRTSALFLTVLPAFVAGGQIMAQPHVYSEKFSDPIFWPAVGVTAALYLTGCMIIRRIINFKY